MTLPITNLTISRRCRLGNFTMSSSSDKDKIIEVQSELIKNLQKQVKEWEDWKASSRQQRHAKGKAKADLAISKSKNTLRFKTTRKPKK